MQEHPFIELTLRHRAAIERICRSFARSDAERDDLRQEILMHLWIGWKHYKPDYRPITWLYRVALNSAISWRRRQHDITTLAGNLFDLPDETVPDDQATHLQSLIAMLSPADQRLIGLYLDGWSTEEMSRILGLSQTNVTTRISRIKEKLRKLNTQ